MTESARYTKCGNATPNVAKLVFALLILCSSAIAANPTRFFRWIPGDVDLDGRVTRADADLVMWYVVQGAPLSIPGLVNADVTGDGTISCYDAAEILRMVPLERKTRAKVQLGQRARE